MVTVNEGQFIILDIFTQITNLFEMKLPVLVKYNHSGNMQ